MLKRIRDFLRKFRSSPNILQFKSWAQVDYKAAVYEIAPTVDDRWAACVCLFMDNPNFKNNPVDNKVIMLRLNITFSTPEEVVTYLHLVGPFFMATSSKAIQIDKTGEIIKIWSVDNLEASPEYVTPTDIVTPTHTGTNTIN